MPFGRPVEASLILSPTPFVIEGQKMITQQLWFGCFHGRSSSASAEKKKAYKTTTERKSFGELFWPQRKTFQAGGGYKAL